MDTFTFDIALFSDLYKDAHGFRPGYDHRFYQDKTTDEERQIIWNITLDLLETVLEDKLQRKWPDPP